MLLLPCQRSSGPLMHVHSIQHNSRGPLSRLDRLLLPCRGRDRLLAHFHTALQQVLQSPLLPAADRAQLEEAQSEAALDLMPLAQAAHTVVQRSCKGGPPGDTRYRWTAVAFDRVLVCAWHYMHTCSGKACMQSKDRKQCSEESPTPSLRVAWWPALPKPIGCNWCRWAASS